jgi:hypothetical protein
LQEREGNEESREQVGRRRQAMGEGDKTERIKGDNGTR